MSLLVLPLFRRRGLPLHSFHRVAAASTAAAYPRRRGTFALETAGFTPDAVVHLLTQQEYNALPQTQRR